MPFGLKDIYDTKGILTSGGSKVCIDNIPQEDATTTRLLTNAATPGNLIGTTGFQTAPSVFTTGANKGLYSTGFGTISPISNGTPQARTGTLIARITF
mgnify:CR=1 FL=1